MDRTADLDIVYFQTCSLVYQFLCIDITYRVIIYILTSLWTKDEDT